MGLDKDRRPLLTPQLHMKGERYTVVAGVSSAGAAIPTHGAYYLNSSSTVATTPTIFYLPQLKLGSVVEAFCTLASSSAGAVLRTPSSAQYIASSSLGWDQVQFFQTGVGVRLVALTTTLWSCIGATTTASGTFPVIGTSTS